MFKILILLQTFLKPINWSSAVHWTGKLALSCRWPLI